jgi:hypothetical protein
MSRMAVAVATTLSLATAAVLWTRPGPARCPAWRLPDATSTPLWHMLALWAIPLLAFSGLIAARWSFFEHKVAERAGAQGQVPIRFILAATCLAAAIASQMPLALLVTRCTDWLGR